MNLFDELQGLMMKYHFRPEKKLSQFFCINEALLLFLAKTAELKKDDIVLEVGPGTGFLTRQLLKKSKVIAVEKDETMFDLLSKEFEKEIKSKELVLINGDVLDQDFNKLGINKIVSLPPYHISSELLTKITMSKIKKAVLVLDKGFIEKLTAFEGMKEYNSITVMINLNGKVEIKEVIDAASFFPSPNCQSAVIEINFKVKNNSREFYLFLKEIFRHKNKDFSRALKQAMPFLEKELKWKKSFAKKIDSIKNPTRKVYLNTPEELFKTFEILKE